MNRKYQTKYDLDGVQNDPNDWTYEDWRDLHYGIRAIKAKIAARHALLRGAAVAVPEQTAADG